MSFDESDYKNSIENLSQSEHGATPVGSVDQTSAFSPIAGVEIPDDTTRPLSVVDAQMIRALPVGSALLIVSRGPNAGARFLLDADVTVSGRHSSCDIFLDDATVSRRHVEFVRNGAAFNIRDTGSLNGTYVNRERVDEQELRAGDSVQIGKYRMNFYPGTGTQQ